MRTTTAALMSAAAAVALSACSGGPSLPSLSTGSLTPQQSAAATPAAAAAPEQSAIKNDPTQRAFQVGSTSARAVKCGFFFDPVKLKQQFLAAEATLGAVGEAMTKIEKIYDVSFNGITRAIAPRDDYCSDAKSKEIKADLTRHLAGDYTPVQKKVAVKEDGFFSGFFDGADNPDSGPKIGTDEWWEKQKEKMGK